MKISEIKNLTWEEIPATKNCAALSVAQHYVISHYVISHDYQYIVSYRPPGQHHHVGVFETIELAKAACEALMFEVWLVSYGNQDDGWFPISICSSEEKALKFGAEFVQEKIANNKKLQLIFEGKENLSNREIIERFNEYSDKIVIGEQTSLDTAMNK